MRKKFMVESRGWILALLLSPGKTSRKGEPIEGSIRLMKELFLLKQKIADLPYDFEAGDYGPWCIQVYRDLKKLAHDNLIRTIPEPKNEYKIYKLTEPGKNKAEEVMKELDSPTKKEINEIKKEFNSMGFYKLLFFVYDKYPQYAVNSILDVDALQLLAGSR